MWAIAAIPTREQVKEKQDRHEATILAWKIEELRFSRPAPSSIVVAGVKLLIFGRDVQRGCVILRKLSNHKWLSQRKICLVLIKWRMGVVFAV